MKRRALLRCVLTLALLIQLGVPAWMIARREWVLRHGEILRFRTAPVDPTDAFRGSYVALSFNERQARYVGSLRRQQVIYVQAAPNWDGYASLVSAARRPGASGVWFRAHSECNWPGNGTNAALVGVNLPFDRFYLDEQSAPEAERLYRAANRRGSTNAADHACWLQVRVAGGLAVPEELYVDGQPMRERVTHAR